MVIDSSRFSSWYLPLSLLIAGAFLHWNSTANAQDVGPRKLPFQINTPDKNELMPVISADGKVLYFIRERTGVDNEPVFDIWSSQVEGDSSYGDARFVGGNLASRFGVAVVSTSPDNNSLYLFGKLSENALPEERLLVTHRTQTGWSIPEPMRIQNLNPHGLYTDYAIGPDQRTLLLAVERDSTEGHRDLYVSFLNSGTWSTPMWLGATVNSPYEEMTPYLAADNKTLYFSSERPGGFGQVDVYRTLRLDDTWRHWSSPENLGPRVNRPGRTTFYTETANGKFAYVVWRANSHDQSDLYRLSIDRKVSAAIVQGRVADAEGKPLLARIYYNRTSDGVQLGSARSNPATGEYQLTLPAGESYTIHAEKDGYYPMSINLDLTALHSFERYDKDLLLTRIQTGATIQLRGIYFDVDKADLLPASYAELDRVVTTMKSYSTISVEISGHTDDVGSAEHNKSLSQGRAEAVRAYLISQGIAAERLKAVGYGATKPIASNTTEEGRSQNRRVEFVISGAINSIR